MAWAVCRTGRGKRLPCRPVPRFARLCRAEGPVGPDAGSARQKKQPLAKLCLASRQACVTLMMRSRGEPMVRTARSLEDPDQAAARQTSSLAALAITLALVVVGLFLVDVLRANQALQDCALTACPNIRWSTLLLALAMIEWIKRGLDSTRPFGSRNSWRNRIGTRRISRCVSNPDCSDTNQSWPPGRARNPFAAPSRFL